MSKKRKRTLIRKHHIVRKHAPLVVLISAVLVGAVIFPQAVKKPPKIDTISPASGSLNQLLTLTGSGFTANTNSIVVDGKTVLMNIPASNETTITFNLPPTIPCQLSAACPIKVSNKNGISNAAPFKLVEGSTAYGGEVTVTVLTPNGGEDCIPGEYCGITWAAYQNGQLITHEVVGNKDTGLVGVKIALVKDTTTNSSDPTNLIVGWIEALPERIAAIRDYAWYAATVTDADNQFTYNVAAGAYKILIVAQDANGQYTLWNPNTNSPGNFDVSDAAFIVQPRK